MRELVSAALAAALVACGGPGSKTPTPPPADAGADAAPAPMHLVSTLPTDVRNAPPFHLESKHVTLRDHPEWAACHAGFRPSGDPSKALGALAGACKTHAASPVMTGTQNATSSPPTDYAFHAQGKRCYRLYAVAGEGVKSLVVVLSDEKGAAIAEYHTDDVSPFVAPDQAMCFADDTDVKIAASVGIGTGPYALAFYAE